MDTAPQSNETVNLDNSRSQVHSAPISVNPSGPPSQFKQDESNNFVILLGTIFGLLFLLFVFLAVLNYFSIISLKNIYPELLGLLPTKASMEGPQIDDPYPDSAYFDSKNNVWTVTGSLHSFNGNNIEIESEDKIIKLEFSSTESIFYKQIPSSNQIGEPVALAPGLLYELERNGNINKSVEVVYKPGANGQKIIQSITLQEQP